MARILTLSLLALILLVALWQLVARPVGKGSGAVQSIEQEPRDPPAPPEVDLARRTSPAGPPEVDQSTGDLAHETPATENPGEGRDDPGLVGDVASLEGTLLTDSGLPGYSFRIEVRTPEGVRRFAHPTPDEQGRFRMTFWLSSPAVFNVQIWSESCGTLLVEVPRVAMEPGQVTRDPLLQGIDLRGRLQVLELLVVDESSQPVRDARIGGDHIDAKTDGSGRCKVPLCDWEREIAVSAIGFRTAKLTLAEAHAPIVLRSGYRVRLELTEDSGQPTGDWMLAVALIHRGKAVAAAQVRGPGASLFDVAPEPAPTLILSDPGEHRLRWALRSLSSGRVRLVEIPGATGAITIADVDQLQTLELHVPAEGLKHALALLRE